MRLKFSLCILTHLTSIVCTIAFEFLDITNDIFPIDTGVLAAFGHFNSDEFTDVFTLQQGGNKLQVFSGSESKEHFHSIINCSYGSVITSVVPADYNGDGLMDILITLSSEQNLKQNLNDVKILWGNNNSLDCKSSVLFSLINQPMIVDFNGDMIPDIIGDIETGERYVWISSVDTNFRNHTISTNQTFRNPHSSGLGDFDNDLVSELLITGKNYIEVWYKTESEFFINGSIPYPKAHSTKYVLPLQSTFIDLNLDGIIDHIMPACFDSNCDTSVIFIWNTNTSDWQILHDNFRYQDQTWRFKLPTGSSLEMAALPVTLRAGDVDMDGYPDFITVMQSKSNTSNVRAVIFKNIPCQNCPDCLSERCLKIDWDVPGLREVANIQIAAFFDIFEDGILDILATSKTKGEWKMHALKNNDPSNSCFIKVLVLSGLCSNCISGQTPYGVNQPGPVVMYNMTKQDGKPVVSSAIQMSQSAHFPLLLPYSVFGLGQTPNFIDVLTVSIPAKFQNSVHKREWTQIIPNSQIVIIPHPPSDESKWVRRLFVTPSHFVLLTCIALIGTCMFISILVALLHWRERKEDKKEKMQDACRFHFDAM